MIESKGQKRMNLDCRDHGDDFQGSADQRHLEPFDKLL
jgi:hypothetical protein